LARSGVLYSVSIASDDEYEPVDIIRAETSPQTAP